MKKKKVLFIILGVAAIILGILCFFEPMLAALLCGIGLAIYGIGSLAHWFELRKAGASSVWGLLGAIISIALGGFILFGNQIGLFATTILLLVVSLWLMAEGVFEIISAVMYRKAMTTVDFGVQAPGSMVSMVLGIFMICFGFIGLIFPVVAEVSLWIWIVLELIISGVRLLMQARAAGLLEESNE